MPNQHMGQLLQADEDFFPSYHFAIAAIGFLKINQGTMGMPKLFTRRAELVERIVSDEAKLEAQSVGARQKAAAVAPVQADSAADRAAAEVDRSAKMAERHKKPNWHAKNRKAMTPAQLAEEARKEAHSAENRAGKERRLRSSSRDLHLSDPEQDGGFRLKARDREIRQLASDRKKIRGR